MLIVVAPLALGEERTTVMSAGVLAVALILAWLTKVAVEDRGQRWSLWKASVRHSILAMVAAIVVVVLATAALAIGGRAQSVDDDLDGALHTGTCVGPRSLHNDDCTDPFGRADSVIMTAKNEYFYTPPECGTFVDMLSFARFFTTLECDFKNGAPPSAEVWLIGNSHAQQWQGAIFDLARANRWMLTTSYYGGCPVADVAFTGFRVPWAQSGVDRCRQWSREAASEVETRGRDLVFTSMAARHQSVDDRSGAPVIDQSSAGLARYWERWAAQGTRVVALGDPPFNGEVRSPDCGMLNPADPLTCAVFDRSVAQPPTRSCSPPSALQTPS